MLLWDLSFCPHIYCWRKPPETETVAKPASKSITTSSVDCDYRFLAADSWPGTAWRRLSSCCLPPGCRSDVKLVATVLDVDGQQEHKAAEEEQFKLLMVQSSWPLIWSCQMRLRPGYGRVSAGLQGLWDRVYDDKTSKWSRRRTNPPFGKGSKILRSAFQATRWLYSRAWPRRSRGCIPSPRGKGHLKRHIGEICRKWGRTAGLHVHLHQLSHSHATHAVQRGVDVFTLQAPLDHSTRHPEKSPWRPLLNLSKGISVCFLGKEVRPLPRNLILYPSNDDRGRNTGLFDHHCEWLQNNLVRATNITIRLMKVEVKMLNELKKKNKRHKED